MPRGSPPEPAAALPPARWGYPEYSGRFDLRPAPPEACFLSVKTHSYGFLAFTVFYSRSGQGPDHFNTIMIVQTQSLLCAIFPSLNLSRLQCLRIMPSSNCTVISLQPKSAITVAMCPLFISFFFPI